MKTIIAAALIAASAVAPAFAGGHGGSSNQSGIFGGLTAAGIFGGSQSGGNVGSQSGSSAIFGGMATNSTESALDIESGTAMGLSNGMTLEGFSRTVGGTATTSTSGAIGFAGATGGSIANGWGQSGSVAGGLDAEGFIVEGGSSRR